MKIEKVSRKHLFTFMRVRVVCFVLNTYTRVDASANMYNHAAFLMCLAVPSQEPVAVYHICSFTVLFIT